MVSAKLRLSQPAGVIAATATGGLQQGCHIMVGGHGTTGHMAMNADLLAPGIGVFYLRGTIGEHLPATVAGLSSFPDCVAISPVMTQVMRMAPRAPTILARNTHRCPDISPFTV